MDSNSLKMWAEACEVCKVKFVKKGTEDYERVRKVFDGLKKVSQTPEQQLWGFCCEELARSAPSGEGHKFVRKGTPEYENVKQLYASKLEIAKL